MKSALANRKAVFEASMAFLLKALLFLVIAGASYYIFNNVALADIKAQGAARNFGVVMDTLSLTTKDATVETSCPSEAQLIIEGDKIQVRISALIGEGFAEYHYLHESNAVLPSRKVIDCSSGTITVTRHIDPLTAQTTINIG